MRSPHLYTSIHQHSSVMPAVSSLSVSTDIPPRTHTLPIQRKGEFWHKQIVTLINTYLHVVHVDRAKLTRIEMCISGASAWRRHTFLIVNAVENNGLRNRMCVVRTALLLCKYLCCKNNGSKYNASLPKAESRVEGRWARALATSSPLGRSRLYIWWHLTVQPFRYIVGRWAN